MLLINLYTCRYAWKLWIQSAICRMSIVQHCKRVRLKQQSQICEYFLFLNYFYPCYDNVILSSVIDIVEDVVDSLPLDGDMPTTIVAANKELAVTAIAPEIGDFPGVSFEVNFNDDGSISEADASLTPSATAPTSLSIPQSLLEDLGVDPADVTDFRVGFSVFRDDSLFQPRSSGEEAESETLSRIGSSVISAQVSGLGVPVANLKTPVLVELSVKPVCCNNTINIIMMTHGQFAYCVL